MRIRRAIAIFVLTASVVLSPSPSSSGPQEVAIYTCSNHNPGHSGLRSQLAALTKEHGCSGWKVEQL